MKVWQLAGQLLWHLLHGRGGDDIYLRLDGDPEELQQDYKNWTLGGIGWTDTDDRFVLLTGTPEVGL